MYNLRMACANVFPSPQNSGDENLQTAGQNVM